MRLVFIHGPPAAGKYTVARRLCELTGLALFHNHLVVDAVHAVFPFGSRSFVRLREQFWIDVFDAALAEDRSLVFTFQPEPTVAPDFAARVLDRVSKAGGQTLLVHLKLSSEGQLARVANQDRAAFGKLRDPVMLSRLQAAFAACEAAMPAADLVFDTELVEAEAAAQQIAARLI